MKENNSLETVLKWVVLVVLGLVALKLLLAAVNIAFALLGIAVKLLPLVLLVCAVVWLVRWLRGRDESCGPRPATPEVQEDLL